MPKIITINTDRVAVAGVPQEILVTLDMSLLDASANIEWAGVRLYSFRPCKKDILISKTDIFGGGILENGVYNRRVRLNLTRQVVPTIEDRDIKYFIRGGITLKENGKQEDFYDDKEIIIMPEKEPSHESRPINLQIKNIKFKTDKDIYKKGENVKIQFEGERIRKLDIQLVKDANIHCRCQDYNKCVYIKPKPPKVVQSMQVKNPPSSDTINFKLPDNLEPSHSWKWIGASKSYFEYSIGDTVLYNIVLTAKTAEESQIIDLRAPIIVEGEVGEEPYLQPKSKKPFEKAAVFSPENITILGYEVETNEIIFKLKNLSNQELTGITATVNGIQSMFFETSPWVVGKKKWNPSEILEIPYKSHSKDIDSYQFLIESNSGISVKKECNL